MTTSTSFEGFKENCLTFKIASSSHVEPGDFVTITNGNEVKYAPKNIDIVGKCIDVNGDYATIQLAGYMTAPFASSATIAYGYVSATLDIDHQIVPTDGYRKILIISYDSATGKVGFIL